MTEVQAVYDGRVFIPKKPCNITRGSEVTLTIVTVINEPSEEQKKLAAFRE
jgi:predicted DNA-binding antitoxin AbrB/MazE fold protein